MTNTADPNEWLEDIEGQAQLDWARHQNKATVDEFASTPHFEQLRSATLAILDNDDKLPGITRRGEFLYNFWRDADHPRGLWRRTTLSPTAPRSPSGTCSSTSTPSPPRTTKWVWAGARPARATGPAYGAMSWCPLARGRRCDRHPRVRPRDTRVGGSRRRWLPPPRGEVDDKLARPGHRLRERRLRRSPDGQPSLTESGYPRITKRWSRGTALTNAPTVYTGEYTDVAAGASYSSVPGFERHFAERATDFYNSLNYELDPDTGGLTLIDLPTDALSQPYRQWLFVITRSPVGTGHGGARAGQPPRLRYDAFVHAGRREATVLFTPDATTSLASIVFTQSHLVLTTLHDVATSCRCCHWATGNRRSCGIAATGHHRRATPTPKTAMRSSWSPAPSSHRRPCCTGPPSTV